jgi:citrate synthase
MPEFTTHVSEVSAGAVNLRGFSLDAVMRKSSHTAGIFLTLIGRLPTPGEERLADAMLNSLLDHGFVASTVSAARYAASGNPQLVPAVAAGLLGAGSNTVSPEHTQRMLLCAAEMREAGRSCAEAASVIVDEYAAAKQRIPGLGHPTHKDSDFRAVALFDIAAEVGVAGLGVEQLSEIHRRFQEASGRRNVPINIDGAFAAITYDMGWDVKQTVAFALLSVLPGVMAHVIEEIDSSVPLRYIENGVYDVGSMTQLEREAD